MERIPVTAGLFALVDDEDVDLVSQFTWHRCEQHGLVYARGEIWSRGPRVRMHRLIMRAEPGRMVDHRNRNGLDNRRENLRFCTYAENARNRRMRCGGFKGVSQRPNGKWQAAIGRNIYLGVYDDPLDAARAYDAAALEMWGEFAALNFPEPSWPEERVVA